MERRLTSEIGNDSDQDSDREAVPAVKAVEKPTARSGKRDAPKAAPVETEASHAAQRGGRGGRGRARSGYTGNEAGMLSNRIGNDVQFLKPQVDDAAL